MQELGHTVDLVVMSTIRESEHFGLEVIQPGRRSRKQDTTGFDLGGFRGDAGLFVTMGV